MSSIPTNDSDIIAWTQEYLGLRRVADLKKLIDRLHLKFPDVGDESRPPARRNKKSFDKAEHVALLWAKRAEVVAAQGGNGSAAGNTAENNNTLAKLNATSTNPTRGRSMATTSRWDRGRVFRREYTT